MIIVVLNYFSTNTILHLLITLRWICDLLAFTVAGKLGGRAWVKTYSKWPKADLTLGLCSCLTPYGSFAYCKLTVKSRGYKENKKEGKKIQLQI